MLFLRIKAIHLNFNILDSLILAGIIQGLLFGIIYFFSKKYKGRSTFYLVALILAFSYNNLQFFIINTEIISGRRMYETFYIPIGSLIPVFIYFYVRAFIYPSQQISKKLKLLYLPFFVFFIFIAVPLKIQTALDIQGPSYSFYKSLNGFQSLFSLFYTITLIILSYLTVVRFEKSNEITNKKPILEYKWLKTTLIILLLLSCLWAFALVIFFSNQAYQLYFNILWVCLSIAIYWLGHLGIYKYGIQKERYQIREFSKQLIPVISKEKRKNEYIFILESLMLNEKRFLDSGLTLSSLAEDLQISSSHLSRIINSELNTNFSDYINSYRVEEAKTLILNPNFSNYTLISIGLEAGFNSKTTFNNVFKKHVGLTPSQFKKENY